MLFLKGFLVELAYYCYCVVLVVQQLLRGCCCEPRLLDSSTIFRFHTSPSPHPSPLKGYKGWSMGGGGLGVKERGRDENVIKQKQVAKHYPFTPTTYHLPLTSLHPKGEGEGEG